MNLRLLSEGTAEQVRELPMSPLSFGLMVIVIFIALLGLVWTFRNTSNKRH
ncbi:MAG TPA: hypothetical protein VKB14_01725 [Actinomycetales bacterium]|nr:hypothetical protein [Actinomycetales bacterium]